MVGTAVAFGCSSAEPSNDVQNVGTVTIPLSTTVGTSNYRLDAAFTITGEQRVMTLTTHDDVPVLSATLPVGDYTVSLDSFTLSKDDGTGSFRPVSATVAATSLPFTVSANSTTTVSFHFMTDGVIVAPGTGTVGVTFDVTESGCNPITVDATARTLQSARFFLDFSNGLTDDPEELDVLKWKAGANLTESYAGDSCSFGLVAHFGNSFVPPDVQSGGKVLVGSGTTGSWAQEGASILIQSLATGCAESISVPVETRYAFRSGVAADTIEVARQFDFGSTPVTAPIRPFVPRLLAAFDQVMHPNAAGTALVTENVFACPYGCELTDWDGSWFAYTSSGEFAGEGMIVRRHPSDLPGHLWVDNDSGSTATNSSSVILPLPDGGFPSQVTERELFCFFDPASWSAAEQAALTLPLGCSFDLPCDAGVSE
jgi:hypothetical protein